MSHTTIICFPLLLRCGCSGSLDTEYPEEEEEEQQQQDEDVFFTLNEE